MESLGRPMGGVPENAFTLGDMENEEAKQVAIQRFINGQKGRRAGSDEFNDSFMNDQIGKIENFYDAKRAAQRDQTTFEYNKQQVQQRYNDTSLALNMDQNQMQSAIQIAQLEVNELALQYGVDVATAAAFKKLFGDMAGLMAQNQEKGDA